jgi:PAS domain S-box-containing protein
VKDEEKTGEGLAAELAELRRRIAELESPGQAKGGVNGQFAPGDPRWHSLAANTPALVLILDGQRRIRFVNHRKPGAVPDGIIGKPFEEFCLPERREAVRACVDRVLETGTPGICEGPVWRVDDQERWYESHLGPILEDGRIVAVSVISIDVTARTRAETALRESERRASLLLETAPLGIHECDTEGRITFVNPSQEQITGYAADELVGTYIWDRIEPGPEKDSLPAYLRRLVSEQPPPTSYVARNVRKNGEIFDVRVDWSYQRNTQGQLTGFLSIVSDVTEQNRVERELRESEQRYRTLAESTTDVVYIVDRSGTLLYANRSAAACMGIAPSALVGKTQRDLFPPDMAAFHVERLGRLFETGEIGDRDERIQFGSEEVWLNIHSIPLRDAEGRITSIMGVCRNITDRRRAEEALRTAHDQLEQRVQERTAALIAANEQLQREIEVRRQAEEALRTSEERFRSYFEQGLIGMAVTGPDKQWIEVNDRLCEIVGYPREELLKMKWTDTVHPDDLTRGPLQFDRAVAGEIDHYTQERRFIRKDGRVVHTNIFVRCFRREDGTVDHLLGLLEDITERKRAQEALHREYRTLKHLLQSSDHERQIIAYEIHDGLAQQLAGAIMQFQTFEHLGDTKSKQAARVYDAGMTMLRQGYFEARRLIAGVRPPILDESGVVLAVGHLVNEQGRVKGPRIEYRSRTDFDRLAPSLENAIYRVVQEGLTNACQHSKSETVRVSLLQRGDRVRIEIQDWGIGFDAKAAQHDRFGLEGIRQRTRLLGGKCNIRSAVGKGTRVAVELPLVLRERDDQ